MRRGSPPGGLQCQDRCTTNILLDFHSDSYLLHEVDIEDSSFPHSFADSHAPIITYGCALLDLRCIHDMVHFLSGYIVVHDKYSTLRVKKYPEPGKGKSPLWKSDKGGSAEDWEMVEHKDSLHFI